MANKPIMDIRFHTGEQENGFNLEELLKKWKEDAREAMNQMVQYMGKVGIATSKQLGQVGKNLSKKTTEQLQQETQKASSSLRRSLMGFDQLNRLVKRTGSGSATNKVVKENEQMTQSLGGLFDKIGQWGDKITNDLFVPMSQWTTGSFMAGLENLGFQLGIIKDKTIQNVYGMDAYSNSWGILNRETAFWKDLIRETNSLSGVFNETLVNSGLQADTTANQMRQLGYAMSDMSQNSWIKLKSTWGGSFAWFSGEVINPVQKVFSTFWSKLNTDAANAWDGTKKLFSGAFQAVTDGLSKAWKSIYDNLGEDGKVAVDMQSGVLQGLKKAINGVIKGSNNVTTEPFSGLNNVLDKIQSIKLGKLQPFSFLSWRVSVPKIPELAQGAVLPANKPFLAMLGDQRHGTNIEAPLSTIQEAVAVTMEDFAAGNMAGHEATVSVLKDILEAVLGISIGDSVIAAAYDRHRAKMSVVYGK